MPSQGKREPLTPDDTNRLATQSRAETLPFSYAAAATAVAHFRLAYYRFVLKATTDIQLPAYKGSSFRGGFGHALKHTVCITPENVCHSCLLRTQCLYPYIFDTKLETHDAEGDGEASLPRPFVLVPPLEDYQHYHPGDLLTCDLVLIGEAIAYLPHFIATMTALGGIGVGKGKGSFTMTQVQALRPQAPACEIYAGHAQTLHNVHPPVTGEELVLPYQGLSPRRITLAFVTPTRLKHHQRLLKEAPAFHIVMRRLLDRLAEFSLFYHHTPLALDFQAWKSHAEQIRLVASRVTAYYYNVTLSQPIQALQGALAMGEIGGMIPPLRILDALQGLLGRQRLLGQDGGQQQQGLPKRQCRRPFFTR